MSTTSAATVTVSALGKHGAVTDSVDITVRTSFLVITVGQSNDVAIVDIDNATDQTLALPQPEIRIWRKLYAGINPPTDPPVFDVDEGPVDLGPRAAVTRNFGPELSMGRAMEAAAPGQWTFAHFALSGISIADHLHPDAAYPSVGPNLFTQLMTFIATVAEESGATPGVMAFVQGETDGQDSTDANNYEENLTDLFDAIWAVYPDLKIVISRQPAGASVITFRSTIRTAQANFVAAHPTNTYLVDTDDMVLSDSVHFDADSIVTNGERYANRALALLDIVNRDPVAAFTSEVTGLTLSLFDTSTDPGDTIVAWSWTFGDGGTSTEQNPEHEYEDTGTYTVFLTVTDSHGAMNTTSSDIFVSGVPWEVDPAKLWGRPNSATQVADVLTATASLDNVYDEDDFIILRCQEDGSLGQTDLADSGSGSFVFSASGTGLLYGQTRTGFSYNFVRTTDASAHKWQCLSSSLPDLDAGTITVVALYGEIFSGTSNVSRSLIQLGTSTVAYVGGAAQTRVASGANAAASAGTEYGTPHAYWLQYSFQSSRTVGGTELTKVQPTHSAGPTGKGITLGTGAINGSTAWTGYVLIHKGSTPMTVADIKRIRTTLGITDAWTP